MDRGFDRQSSLPPPTPLVHGLSRQVEVVARPIGLRQSTVTRLGLLLMGIIAAQSCMLAPSATELDTLALTRATGQERHLEGPRRRLPWALTEGRLAHNHPGHPLVAAGGQ